MKGMTQKNEIIHVDFNPPTDARLAVEAMEMAELLQRAPAEHFRKLQRADFFRLIGVTNGETEWMVDFSTFPASPGHWLLVRPGQVMRYDFSRPWSGWMLVFRPDGLYGNDRPGQSGEFNLLHRLEGLGSQHTLDHQQRAWMDSSLRQIQTDCAWAGDVTLRNEVLRLQLASTLLRLSMWQEIRQPMPVTEPRAWAAYKRFQLRLETDFAKAHKVQHYALALGMGEKNLSRVCLATMGVSAKACINQRLVLEAKRLLAHTTRPVQAIGHALGFEDATNFVKFFRKETGLTPGGFRQTNA